MLQLQGYLAGDDGVDDVVAATGGVVTVPERLVAGPDDERACLVVERTLAEPTKGLVVVQGPDGVGRRTVVARARALSDGDAVAVDLRRLATGAAVEATLAALRREVVLRGAIPVVAGVEELADATPESGARVAALERFVDDIDVTAVLVTSGEGIPLASARPLVRVSLPVPQALVRRVAWDRAVGETTPVLAATLDQMAVRDRMGVGGIGGAVKAARAAACARDGALAACDLVEGVRATVGNRFGDLARRLDVAHAWTDLVLPEDIREQIDLVTARARHAYEVLETWGFATRMPRGGAGGPPLRPARDGKDDTGRAAGSLWV